MNMVIKVKVTRDDLVAAVVRMLRCERKPETIKSYPKSKILKEVRRMYESCGTQGFQDDYTGKRDWDNYHEAAKSIVINVFGPHRS